MTADATDAQVSEIESREMELLRQEEEINQRLREKMDTLSEGHPTEEDTQHKELQERYDAYDQGAGTMADMSGMELGAAGLGAVHPEVSVGAYRDIGGHIKQSHEYRQEMLEMRGEANDVVDEWKGKLREEMDQLQNQKDSLEPQREQIIGEAEELKTDLVQQESELLHDPEQREQFRELDNYAARLDAVVKALRH